MKLNEIFDQPSYKTTHVGQVIDGLVVGDNIPNTSSISATFTDYDITPGIHVIPMGELDTNLSNMFYARNDMRWARELATEIETNGYIDPLIVVQDAQGLYILEGGHRFAALCILKKKEFPAMVVRDLD